MTNPALTIAIAITAGMMAQSIAYHLRIPGIVLLLTTGVVLGPDVANIVQPALLESGLSIMVGFAVAVILFEGGMNLRIDRIRRESRTIWLLLTLGALVSVIGGTLAARTFQGLGLESFCSFRNSSYSYRPHCNYTASAADKSTSLSWEST